MSIRKQSPYGPFVERVLLPALRIGLLLLIVLAIGFGSWLETNESTGDCAFKNSMSFHQVYLYRNITSNLTTPDSVSFGLWKTCYFYALNCSYVSTILQVATEHNATPPLTESTSLSRIIPLMLATIIGGVAFFVGLWANRRGKYMFRKIVVALLCACAVLITYAFGWTYDQYFKMIVKTCKDRNNTIYCARHAVGIEVVIFAIVLALLFIAFIFWFFASAFFTKKKDLYEQEEPFNFFFWRTRSSSEISEYFPTTKRRRPIPSEKPLQDNTPPYQSQDELELWSDDVNMFDDKGIQDDGYWEAAPNDDKKQHPYYYDSPPIVEQKRTLSPLNLNEKVSLTPPPPASTNHLNSSPRAHKLRASSNEHNNYHHKSRKSRKSSFGNDYHSNNNSNGSPPQKYPQSTTTTTTRKESHDSSFTFGNHKRQHRRRSSARPSPKSDQHHHQQQQSYNKKPRNKTPTSMSPHPFQFPINNNEMTMRNSFCMTPYYYNNEDNGSSGSGSGSGGSSSSGYFNHNATNNTRRTSNQFQVPILSMPPAAIEHPLNKKIITDKRIQSYLKQQQQQQQKQQYSNTPNST
ncbi:hypothetical protein [Parasitella parasitica]|uniref:Uncharacterized protein n=1 Tax=Parasitella parasitica TaxID=35722 RepID=A0A0B7MX78_9FUNG|nr:hypothetical protein [Parasitella parasitica]